MDLEPYRKRATEVLTAMAQDVGPVEAEPYSSWAESLADDVIDLIYIIESTAAR